MNNISFKSKINFVSPEAFNKIANGENFYAENTFVTGKDLQTRNIKNCTGILAVDYEQGYAIGAHVFPNEYELHVPKKRGYMTDIWNNSFKIPQKVFLIGSKRIRKIDISVRIFQKYKNLFKKNAKDLTFFQEHVHLLSGSDFVYHYDDDTLTVCTRFVKPEDTIDLNENTKVCYVSNAEDLLECFKKIKIADNDVLCFENKPFDFKKYYNFGRILKQRLKYIKEVRIRPMHK